MAFLERQLEIAHQENASLQRQLKEQKNVTQSTLPIQDEENKRSRKRLRGQGQNMNTKKKVENCRYCGKAKHKKKDFWKRTGKCFRCGSSEHKIKDCPKLSQRPRLEPNASVQPEESGMARRAGKEPMI